MSDEQLAEHWSGLKENTGDWHLTNMEVKRRQNAPSELRGWASLVLSIAALVVSIVSLYVKTAA